MLKIDSTKHFNRQLEKLSRKHPQIKSSLRVSLSLLVQNEFQSKALKIHKLKGYMDDCYAFSLTYNLRVIFKRIGNLILLVNVGTHDEVY